MKTGSQAGAMAQIRDGAVERETGIEPATSSLGSWRSTAELLPPVVDFKLRSLALRGISPAGSRSAPHLRRGPRTHSRPLSGSSWRSTAELLPPST